MPIYEYVCEACGGLTEVMQRMSDPAPTDCPECGERKLARLVSRTSFQLKGGGWYSDLYASPKKKPEAGGADKAAAPGGGADKGGSGSQASDSGSGSKASDTGSKPSGGDSKPSGSGPKPSGSDSKTSGGG